MLDRIEDFVEVLGDIGVIYKLEFFVFGEWCLIWLWEEVLFEKLNFEVWNCFVLYNLFCYDVWLCFLSILVLMIVVGGK